MASMLRSHLRNNVVGYIALVLALLGVPTAYAIGVNTVGSKQIKPGGVKVGDIAAGAVGSRAIENGSVSSLDLATDGGGSNANPVVTVRRRRNDYFRSAQVSCLPNEQLLGGGGWASIRDENVGLSHSHPFQKAGGENSPVADSWNVRMDRKYGVLPRDSSTTAYALCANWGQLRTGPQGPPGPPGEIADQQCPAENMFVRAIVDGEIDCAYLNIVG
jgi:hypothetical protein